MCARYNLRLTNLQLQEFLHLTAEPPEYPFRYNISPAQFVPTVTQSGNDRVATDRKWGLIPSWVKGKLKTKPPINAKSETVNTHPMFRAAIKRRRCLLPSTGFYEWNGPDDARQPWLIAFADDEPMVFAGIWETWTSPEGKDIETFAMLTTAANPFMSELPHERMPVILKPSDWDFWLDPEIETGDPYLRLYEPWNEDNLKRTAMHPKLNSSKHEGAAYFEILEAN